MIRLLLCMIAILLLPATALAQKPNDKRVAAGQLLDSLRQSPSEDASGAIEARIRQLWFEQTTPAVALLLNRGIRDMQAGAHDEAIAVFDDVIVLDPSLAEAWHQRAVAKFHAGNRTGAIRDIEETLKREPRNFAALRTLGEIAASREDWKNADAAWLKVLEVSPKTPGGAERIKDLKRRALGEET